ncbi:MULTISPECIES: hypothetical protein [unclassified Streptomyces]|uniref:hypothetical protein n=1 Tax=Streptomyces sp. NPDC055082 TaxID=3365718 RepID=UPI0037D40297
MSRTVFEHVEGGALCYFCPKGRGVLCKTADGNRFICDRCRAGLRRDHEQTAHEFGTEPSRFTYVPIIDTLDFKP